MFYPVSVSYVGPNSADSDGHSTIPIQIGTVEIYNVPQRTNMSNEERTDGWLGCTCDNDRYALGEYETIEETREAIAELGYTEPIGQDDIEDSDVVEAWTKEAALMAYMDAADWYNNVDPTNITSDTTDEDIEAIAQEEEEEALACTVYNTPGVVLTGTESYLLSLRNNLRAERDDDA